LISYAPPWGGPPDPPSGPSVAIFSVLKALLVQPFYYPEPDRLVQVWETDISERGHQPFAWPDYFDIREQNTAFKDPGV